MAERIAWILTLVGLFGCVETAPRSDQVDRGSEDTPEGVERFLTIRGRIVDATNAPIAGAVIHAGVYTVTRSTPSANDGQFLVEIGPGYSAGSEIPLTLSAPGYVRSSVRVELGEQEAALVLERGAALAGRLVVPKGMDAPGSHRVILRSGSHQQEVDTVDGRFVMTGFEPGNSRSVEVRADGFVPFWFRGVELRRGETLELGDLALDPGGSLTVSASDHFGAPVAGAHVEIRRAESPSFTWSAITDAGGVARVRGLSPGATMSVTTTPPEGFGRSVGVERDVHSLAMESGQQTLGVVLHRPVVLRGVLVWSGDGDAPWRADSRLRIRARGTSDAGSTWRHDGAVPDTGVSLGERDAVEFVIWARPGAWDLAISVEREGESRRPLAPIGLFTVPAPKRGQRSGEMDLGQIPWPPRD